LDYPKDIRYLADHLGLEKYYTLGVSGGTGYALACAKMLSAERLRGVSICAGIGSWEFGLKGMSLRNKFGLYMWKWRPDWLTKHIEKTYVPLAQDPDPEKMAKQLRAEFSSFLKRIDAEIMMKDENLQSAVRSFRQVYGAGSEGHKVDILLNTRSWGFDLGDVAYRGIRLWYGSDDENTPPEMGRHMASRLYGSTYREDQGESYYSIWRKDALEEFILGMLRPRKES
jgi:pimeloyl-ACP methyl ester carboxylesterase